MHGHGSTRAERVCSDVFWGKTKSGLSHLQIFVPSDGNAVGCADRVEDMIGGKITDGGSGIISLVAQVEEDVDDRLDWTGCGGIRIELRDGLTVDYILLIVEGDENLDGLAEIIGGGVPGEKKVYNEEHKVCEGRELDRPEVAGALPVFAVPEGELESNSDQFSDVMDSWVEGDICCNDDGVQNSQGNGLLLSDGGSLSP